MEIPWDRCEIIFYLNKDQGKIAANWYIWLAITISKNVSNLLAGEYHYYITKFQDLKSQKITSERRLKLLPGKSPDHCIMRLPVEKLQVKNDHLLKNKSQVSRNAINQLQFQGINLGNFLAFDDTVEQQVPDFWEKDQ